MSLFSGDMLVAAHTPAGQLHVMLGDFTGHGLSAAMGAMPVSDIFYSMTAKGFSPVEILREINRRLLQILPTQIFFACGFLEVNFHDHTFSVWNGGLPDILLFRPGRGILSRFPSSQLPLGVVDEEQIDFSRGRYPFEGGERFYLYSDGVVEARNKRREMFGRERLESCFPAHEAEPFHQICTALERFREGDPQTDDTTLIEVVCDEERCGRQGEETRIAESRRVASHWHISLELGADALQRLDPKPMLIQMVRDLQGLEEHRQAIYTILVELFGNALEHGLLGLDSSRKVDAEGFAAYYQQRQEALARLREGCIRVEISHRPLKSGGELTLAVEDSGPGFKADRPGQGATGYSGRGMALVRSLCERLHYNRKGNRAVAVYRW